MVENMSILLKTALKNPDLSNNISIKIDNNNSTAYDSINSVIDLNKPLNRNVWE